MADKERSAKDYEEMSRAVEAGDYSVNSPVELGATLNMGRPVANTEPADRSNEAKTNDD
jgi:hypothetical protein